MTRALADGVPVVPIVDSGTFASGRRGKITRNFYVMPWMSGGSLEEAVRDRRFVADPLEGLRVLLQLSQALERLHAIGLAHRDLKPANLLMAGDRLLLADFGLVLPVAAEDRSTSTRRVVGSRGYLAPEHEAGLYEHDDHRAADFYAFGKLLWVLLAGEQPRPRELQIEDRDWYLEGQSGHPELSGLLGLQTGLLRRTPRDRVTDWGLVIQELVRVIDRFQLKPPPPPPVVADDDVQKLVMGMRQKLLVRGANMPFESARREWAETEDRRALREALISAFQATATARWSVPMNQLREQFASDLPWNWDAGSRRTGGGTSAAEVTGGPTGTALEEAGFSFQRDDLLGHDETNAESHWWLPYDAGPSATIRHYFLVAGNDVWCVRRVFVERWQKWLMEPDWLYQHYGVVRGPFPLGTATAKAQVEALAEEFGVVTLGFLDEYLRRERLGVADSQEAWQQR
jgi:hypothetical protein